VRGRRLNEGAIVNRRVVYPVGLTVRVWRWDDWRDPGNIKGTMITSTIRGMRQTLKNEGQATHPEQDKRTFTYPLVR
jgi:hypothetical protein